MKHIVSLLSVITASVFLFSCSPKLSPDNSWGERKWVLYELDGVPVQLSGTNKDAHLVFLAGEKRIAGSGGCNRITGSYILNGKKLSFTQTASTRMICNDQPFEDKFLSVLKTVDRYAQKDATLILKKGKKVVMRFR